MQEEHTIVANKPSRSVRSYLRRLDAARTTQHLSGVSTNIAPQKPKYRRRRLEQTLASLKLPSPRRRRIIRRSPSPLPQVLREQSSQPLEERDMVLDFGPTEDYDYNPPAPRFRAKNREFPSSEKLDLYGKWNAILPLLLLPLLAFTGSGSGSVGAISLGSSNATRIGTGSGSGSVGAISLGSSNGTRIGTVSSSHCIGESCPSGARNHKVCFVFLTHFNIEYVKLCDHTRLPVLLVARGFFPSGPSLPGYAFSVDLLNLFLGLTRNGGNSVQSLAASLHEQHRNYGHVLRGPSGQPIQEGYRRTLQSALQWYDALLSLLDDEIRTRIATAREEILYSDVAAVPSSPRSTGLPSTLWSQIPQSPASTPQRPRIRYGRAPTVEDVVDQDDIDAEMRRRSSADANADRDSPILEQLHPPVDAHRPAWHPAPRVSRQPSASAAADETAPAARAPPEPAPMAPVPGDTSGDPSSSSAAASMTRAYLAVAERLGLLTGQTQISQYLVGRCPKCFAVEKTGILLSAGGDFQCALDGNFSHRRNKKAGRSPSIRHVPRALVPKEFVDAIGDAIDAARSRPARPYESEVPASALKQCESAHTAASGSQAKATGEIHDEKGLMALVCRHDIPLFFCNIDTPGEQQKYSIALLVWLMHHLPDTATVLNLYDIGCVADRVKNAYDILPPGMGDRIMFATSAMHAYAHQWECQLVFSPRMKAGLGLTDGEGVERLWSRLRKLIGHLRHVSKERRLVILDRHMEWIASTMRDDMGRWLSNKWKSVVSRERAARMEVSQSGRSTDFLRRQWREQREHQLNVRRLTPPRLRKELEAVMALQDNIESVEEAITSAEAAVKRSRRGQDRVQSLAHLEELRDTHIQLTAQADALYSALNVHDTFPEVQDLGYDFVRALIMAYDAKCIARRKLIGRFFEWDYLDQAVGGKGTPLGTHQHQRTVRAIQKRAPAIRNAIARYNTLCVQVRDLLPQGRSFPLPEELPTDLTQLKNDPSLLEDVWIVNLPAGAAPWLTEPDVRVAIRAQLILDRCAEERIRLAREEKQLYEWLSLEAQAIVHALFDSKNSLFTQALRREYARLEDLTTSCTKLQIPAYRWKAAVEGPMAAAEAHAGALALEAGQRGPDTPEDMVCISERSADDQNMGIPELSNPARTLNALSHGLQTPPATPYRQRTTVDAPDAGHDEDLWSDDNASESDMDAGDADDLKAATSDDAILVESDDDDDEVAIAYLDAPVDVSHVDKTIASLVLAASQQPHPALPTRRLIRQEQGGFKRISIEPEALAGLLAGSKANDDVVYAGIAALAARFPRRAGQLAVLQTYEYRLWCDSRSIARLRGLLSRTQYWRHEVIVIPIFSNLDKHWMLAVVYTQHRLIDFYDSFGSSLRWREHVPKIAALLDGLERDARSHKQPLAWNTSSTQWTTAELVRFTAPHQENLVDCGLWVLAVVAAVMRGWRSTLLPDVLMPEFRKFMYCIICDSIPLSSAPVK